MFLLLWFCSDWIFRKKLEFKEWPKPPPDTSSCHSPSSAEDEGVLDSHHRPKFRTLRVMVLATVLAPCQIHITSVFIVLSHTHTHTHGTVRAGVILTDELIWRLFSHYANLQRGKVFACLPESSSLVALSFTAHLHEGSTLTSVSGCNWTSEPAHRLMWDPSGVRECISPTGCTLVPYGNISWFLFYAKQLTRVFEHMQPGE